MSGPSREEIALEEVGHTEISPMLARWVVALFLLGITLVPLVQIWHDWGEDPPLMPEISAILPRPALDKPLAQWLPPTHQIKAFERHMEERSLLQKNLLGPTQNLLLNLGLGNERAYLGKDGWLFFRDGIDHLSTQSFLDPDRLRQRARTGNEWQTPPQPDPRAAITHFAKQLAARQIQLVIVPTPVKGSIHPEQFSDRTQKEPVHNPGYAPLLQDLADSGIPVVDLAPILWAAKGEGALYLKTDTHWTPLGMTVAANAISARVCDLLGQQPGRSKGPEYPHTAQGDIARMLKLPEPCIWFQEETVIQRRFEPTEGETEVLLLGDSFTNIYSLPGMGWGEHAGLAETLNDAIPGGVSRIAVNDNGAFASRAGLAEALREGGDPLKGKKLVIWQFATRELSLGDWRLIDLPEPRKREPGNLLTHISGRITEVAPPPRPGQIPYKDAIMSMGVQLDEGPLKGQTMVLFCWGMRDNLITDSGRVRPGTRISVDVRPWAEKIADLGGYTRMELPTLSDAPLYWTETPILGDTAAVKTPDTANAPLEVSAQPIKVSRPTPGGNPRERWLQEQYQSLTAQEQSVWVQEQWLYFTPELKALSTGPFWEGAAPQNPEPAILDFARQVKAAGAELLLLPVPAKLAIMADTRTWPEGRLGQHYRDFAARLAQKGVTVLDLEGVFSRLKNDGTNPFLRTDTHWSPAGIEAAATMLVDHIGQPSWLADLPKTAYQSKTGNVPIEGDLLRFASQIEPETVEVNRVFLKKGRRPKSVKSSPDSPVLLLGDSHTLVFHAGGDMLANGAGLTDQLALKWGFPLDLVGVRGSGATPARLDLKRRGNGLAGKKLVIWCFTVREYTEASGGWHKVAL